MDTTSAQLAPGGAQVSPANLEELTHLVALLRLARGTSWRDVAGRLLEGDAPITLWESTRPATLLGDDDAALAAARADVNRWLASGLQVLSITDERYPARLRGVLEAPPLLFARGMLLADEDAVSVVGSRKASARGLQIAADVAGELARRGTTVVSGLAAGIDTAAHTAALGAGGRTVAVIGTGHDHAYPPANHGLQEAIGRRGLVLSQFWPDARSRPESFRVRNATMSGFGLATFVVEAGETSGARIQARVAVQHGRPVILSDAVVAANDWAKALVGQPGVRVADSIASVLGFVEELRGAGARLDDAVRRLIGI